MNSLTDLREVVDVVIGVDTHVHTHSAAVVDAATGGVLDEITVEATAQGYAELVEFANNHPMLRAWAIEGTGGHGAGLSRHLLERSEIVIELDRPKRAARRNGAKSDPLDAIRAAREAMARPRLGTPRAGGERQALSVLLAARRSAVNASTEAQQQVFSLVIAAPEAIRVRFRGQKLAGDAQHRREPASARFLGHRDDQHRGGAADLGSSRARDAERGAAATDGDGSHHPQRRPTCSRSSASGRRSGRRPASSRAIQGSRGRGSGDQRRHGCSSSHTLTSPGSRPGAAAECPCVSSHTRTSPGRIGSGTAIAADGLSPVVADGRAPVDWLVTGWPDAVVPVPMASNPPASAAEATYVAMRVEVSLMIFLPCGPGRRCGGRDQRSRAAVATWSPIGLRRSRFGRRPVAEVRGIRGRLDALAGRAGSRRTRLV